MKKTKIALNVNDAAEKIKLLLLKKQFEIFADIDHRDNAKKANLDMPESRVLIFGNPLEGTKLMQDDIFISFDLPLRLALVEKDNETYLLHQTKLDYDDLYELNDTAILENIDKLFMALTEAVSD